MIDRLPPQSLEAEQSVLGAMLIDRDAVIEVAEFLRPADFYRQANGRIYAAVLDLFERREPIDIVTVAETLERRDELEAVGGRAYLSSLSNETPTAVHVAQPMQYVVSICGCWPLGPSEYSFPFSAAWRAFASLFFRPFQ